MKILDRIKEFEDSEYKKFHSSLMPTVQKAKVIGVRVPHLRKIAKEIYKTSEAEEFLNSLPHKYYEENNVHGMLLEKISDFDECIKKIDEFLPHINNWATCDLIKPKTFKKHPDKLILKIKEWIKSDKTYTIRFGLEMLMTHFLDENFKEEYLFLAAKVKSDEYYVNMMIAWFFATALAKQWESVVKFIEENRLSKWVHNKTIQKAIESYRITTEQKEYLKKLRL